MAVGLALSALLMPSSLRLAHLRLGLDTLIYAAFMIATGFQGVLFAVLSRVYAVQERLYPADAGYRHLYRHITLERGVIAGSALALGGFLSTLLAFYSWHQSGYGDLVIEHIARISIPSGLAITLGMEAILFSFFLSTLGIHVRRYSNEPAIEFEPALRSEALVPEGVLETTSPAY